MKRKKILFMTILTFIIVLGICNFSMAAEPTATLPITVTLNRTEEQNFVKILNELRGGWGSEYILQIDSVLQNVAEKRAAEISMAFDHKTARESIGVTGWNNMSVGVICFLEDMGYPKKTSQGYLNYDVRENIAVGLADANSVYQGWYNSTGHNYTMCLSNMRFCGVGAAEYAGTTYWALVLSDKQLGSVVSSLSPGRTRATYNIEMALQNIVPYFFVNSCYYGETYTTPIHVRNPYVRPGEGHILPGYSLENTGLLKYTCHNPEIFTMNNMGHVIPHKVGTGTVTVSIAGSAPVELSFTVKEQFGGSMTDSDGVRHEFNYSIIGPSSYTYTGSAIEPKVKMTDWYGKEMTEGVDYYLVYEDNVEPGTATIIPHGMGNYAQSNGGSLVSINRRVKFTINRAPETGGTGGTGSSDSTGGNTPAVTPSTEPQQPSTERPKPSTEPQKQDEDTVKFTIKLAKTSYTATGKAIEPEVSVYNGSQKVSSLSYDVSYSNNVNPGTATVTVKGKRGYSGCTATASFTITPGASSGTENMLSVKLAKSSCTANGKTQKPGVSVYFGTKKLGKKDYTVSYKNNKNPGVATVTVKGKGSYAKYAAKASFKILPRKGTVSSFKSTGKKKAVLKWKKDASVTGFQVQVAGNAKFTSGRKTYTASAKKTSVTIKGLSSKKTYYVRIRAYKKAGNTVIYGSWSKTAKTKVK